jgi:hypothetical protein
LRILSIIAAIRFDEMPDQIGNVLYSSLMDSTVPDPSLPNTFMGAKLDKWEEVTVGECVLSYIYACLLVSKCNAFSFTRLSAKLVSHNNQI